MSLAVCVRCSKWTPSTSVSTDVTANALVRVTAASSPLPRTTLSLRLPTAA